MYRYVWLLCLFILLESSIARPSSTPENGLDLLVAARNCRLPFKLIDGVCRGFSANVSPVQYGNYMNSEADKNLAKNIINVPQNCPSGQEWINGACRDVWIKSKENDSNNNVISLPNNCPDGQEWINGQCRDVWAKNLDVLKNFKNYMNSEAAINLAKNIINVPQNCPSGQEWINGACRDVWIKSKAKDSNYNVISVPNNCPDGQEWINGQCRDVWAKILDALKNVQTTNLNINNLSKLVISALDMQSKQELALNQQNDNNEKNEVINEDIIDPKNIISVPNQCPDGYRPDANGICREIW